MNIPLRAILSILVVGIAPLIPGCSGGNGAGSVANDAAPRAAILSWDAVNAGNLTGYRVYYGISSRNYIQPIGQGLNAGDKTSFTVSGLNGGTRYYFAVTGYDNTSGFESGYSNEVFKDFP